MVARPARTYVSHMSIRGRFPSIDSHCNSGTLVFGGNSIKIDDTSRSESKGTGTRKMGINKSAAHRETKRTNDYLESALLSLPTRVEPDIPVQTRKT